MSGEVEYLNKGLTTARDRSILDEAELSAAEDVMAIPGNVSLKKAYGRLPFAGLNNVTGIGFCNFDSVESKIAAVAGGSYYLSNAGETGAFVQLSEGAGDTIEVVNTQDKAILMSGAGDTNRVLLSSGFSRPHGMQPVRGAPGLIHTATDGTWPLGADSVPGFYEYWTTEVYKSGSNPSAVGYDEVESTFEGTTATIPVTASTSYVTITRPNVVNGEATHWRIYRSNKKEAFFEAQFPIGFLIADVPINTVQFNDGLTTTTAFTLPATASTFASPFTPLADYYVAWNNPNNVLLDDAATATSGDVYTQLLSAPFTGSISVRSQLRITGFGAPFANIGSPITNILVQVEGSRVGPASLRASLSWDNGASFTSPQTVPLTESNSTVTVDGGQWGRVWNGAEVADGAFVLLLEAGGPAVPASEVPPTANITLDFVKVAITHSGTTAQQVVAFPSIELLIGGERFPRGANAPPPRATTGDMFQGAMLMNDVDNPTHAVWTIPGTIDYAPREYRNAFDDKINCIRTLGNVAVLGGDESLIRMAYLPVAEDPEFNTGRAIETFDTEGGIPNHKGASRFLLNGRLMLFYVSQHSLRMTDGYTTQTATDDILWTDLVDEDRIRDCFIENNVQNQEILVYFPAASGGRKTLRLSYDSTQLKNGKLRVISLTNYGPTSATAGVLTSGKRLLLTAKEGVVYVENRGYTDISGGTIVPKVTTREIHKAGQGNSWELPKIAVHHQDGGGILHTYATTALANGADIQSDQQTVTMDFRGLSIIDTAAGGDGITVTMTGEDDGLPWEVDYLVLYPSGQGDSAPITQ
jgi:hypothetical protein